MNIKSKYIERAAYIWIYSAIVIFFFGFLKWYFAVPAAAAAVGALVLVFRGEKNDTIYISTKMIIIGALMTLAWMVLSGQGAFVNQFYDWHGRNAQLNDLVAYSWPVYYSDGSAFTYYIGHFIVPAFFGKLFGLAGARAALFMYTATGTCIIWIYMVKILRANTAVKQFCVFLLLVVFGNTESIRIFVTNIFIGLFHISPSAATFGFTPNYLSFGGVFNQIVCAFLVLCMFFDDDTMVENFIVMGVPLLMFTPFMMLGIVVIFAVGTARAFIASEDKKIFMKRIFSIQNLCALLVIFPVILMYLSGNVLADKPDELKMSLVSHSGQMTAYFLYIIFDFILYSICLFPRFKKNAYFYAANLILMILPFLHMGLYNDILTRCGSVGLFVLMLCSGDFLLNEHRIKSRNIRKVIICVLIAAVAIPCMSYYNDELKNMSNEIAAGTYSKKWANSWVTYEGIGDRLNAIDVKYGYYTFDAKDHFFFKYMARK